MKQSDKISKYFTYGELWVSEGAKRLGINNEPTMEHFENLKWLANNIADPCRDYVGGPLHGSFYRSAALNAATPGASKLSFHMWGMASDLDCDNYGHGDNASLFRWMNRNLTFAQIIWEYGTDEHPDWIHVTAFDQMKGLQGGLRFDQKKLTRCVKGPKGEPVYIPFDLPL